MSIKFEELREQLRAESTERTKALLWQREPPVHLYHYTSVTGLLGIISTHNLRGSNYLFLNDRSEFQHSQGLFTDVLEAGANAEKPGCRRRALLDLARLHEAPTRFDLYLTSFCESADLLSQWRGYGQSGFRYCIEFDAATLKVVDSNVSPTVKVCYDKAEQEKFVREVVRLHVDHAEECYHDAKSFELLGRCLFSCVFPAMPFLKHSSFHSEQEWRCVVTKDIDDASGVEFASSNGVSRPFRVLLEGSDVGPKLPITKVIAAGGLAQGQASKLAQLALRRFGYFDVPVEDSSVPLTA